MSGTILIVGGGIGGLALANGLQKHNIPFHVFERDHTQSYRAQGYRIRIGGPALDGLEYLLSSEAMSDFDLSCADFSLHAIPELDAETARLDEPRIDTYGATTNVNMNAFVAMKARVVDRGAMREVLIKHLDSSSISYGKKLARYEETDDGVVAHFEDGTFAHGGLLVGCDGRNSKVRSQLLPDLKVLPTGSSFIYGKTLLVPEVLEELHKSAGQRMGFVKDRFREEILAMAFEPIRFLNAEQRKARELSVPEDYLYWVLTAPSELLGFKTGESHQYLTLEESERRAVDVTKHWHPSVRTVVEHQVKGETSAFAIEIVDKEFGQQAWAPNAHVTLIGDAVHPVAATGSGAVMAINDSKTLCAGITGKAAGVGYLAVVREYEEVMRKTASQAIPASWAMMEAMTSMTRSNEMHIGEMAMRQRAKIVAKMNGSREI